jgi:hypothetical protein
MKRNQTNRSFLFATVVASLVGAACASDVGGNGHLGDPTEGDSYLSIVGDQNVFLGVGERETLSVRYHDGAGLPLAGSISFRLEGSAGGATLSATSGVTNSEGIARVEVVAGADAAAFQVVAEAAYAQAATWNVAVYGGEPPKAPLTVTGTYDLESHFDLASGVPGTVGTIINTFIDMTDDPHDPATWLIDLALDQLGNSAFENSVKAGINLLRPGLDAELNAVLLGAAPDFVETILELGNKFGQVARKFGLDSVLDVHEGAGLDPGELRADHTVTGFFFVVDGVTYKFLADDLDLGEIVATDVVIGLQGEVKMLIGEHALPVSYGRMLLAALNHVIIPLLDSSASSLYELLDNQIDCKQVGTWLGAQLGFGASLVESACKAGLLAVSTWVEGQILGLDGTGAALVLEGEARMADLFGDRRVERLQQGLWEGEMHLGSLVSTLAKPDQKFVGDRR